MELSCGRNSVRQLFWHLKFFLAFIMHLCYDVRCIIIVWKFTFCKSVIRFIIYLFHISREIANGKIQNPSDESG